MAELIPISSPRDEEPVINFASPETIIIEVIGHTDADQTCPIWDKHQINTVTIIGGEEGVMGTASYEQAYGGFLDYAIIDGADCPGEGWFVTEVSGYYTVGDRWMTDDNLDFYFGHWRPATPEEIAQA